MLPIHSWQSLDSTIILTKKKRGLLSPRFFGSSHLHQINKYKQT